MALHHSNFCLVKPRERALRDKTKRKRQGPIPYALWPIIVSSRKVPPHKEAKNSPVNLGIFEAQHQTNCNTIVFNVI